MMNVNDINAFDKEIKEGVVLLDFFADWCGPCKTLKNQLEMVEEEVGQKVKIIKINVDEYPHLASRYDLMSIPTMIFLKDGLPFDKVIGFRPKDEILNVLGKV